MKDHNHKREASQNTEEGLKDIKQYLIKYRTNNGGEPAPEIQPWDGQHQNYGSLSDLHVLSD